MARKSTAGGSKYGNSSRSLFVVALHGLDGKILLCPLVVLPKRERRQGVWALYLKSGDPEFRSCPDHYLDSPPWLCLDLTCSLKSRVIVILALYAL